MADPNVAMFRLRFPEFSEVSDPQVAYAIEESTLIVGSLASPRRSLAILYHSAHILSSGKISMENEGANAEVVGDSIGRISQSVSSAGGGASVQFAEAPELKSTYYGRRYLQVCRIGQSPVQML